LSEPVRPGAAPRFIRQKKVVRGRTSSRLSIAASWRWSLMCEMISLKECLHMIEMRCFADGLFFFCNFMFLFHDLKDLPRVVKACSWGRVSLPWPRMSTITIMSFLSYRDAIQLHDSHSRCPMCECKLLRHVIFLRILDDTLPRGSLPIAYR